MTASRLSRVAVALVVWGCSSSSSSATSDGGAGAGSGGSSGGAAGSSSWPGGAAGVGGSGGAAGSGGAPLPCDARFSFSDNPATAGVDFEASFTDSPGYAYVGMNVSGPGSPTTTWVGVSGTPHVWTWTVSGHGAGVLDFTFVKDANGGPGTPIASCQIRSLGSGGSGGTGGGSGATGGAPPVNRYGMGYVSEGSAADHDLTAKLVGPGGYVTVIFADIKPGRTTADASWKASIQAAYDRDLIPVIRMAPPWGDRRVRDMGESPTSYKGLAQVYRDVIADLPKRAGWPMYVEVHNEPNLCYEWACDSGSLSDQQMASEYAHMLSDVADAVHSIGDPRIRVLNGALAPGGVTSCDCATQNGSPGTLSTAFLGYMQSAVPGVFDKIDAFASHSYPASGEGYGFFAPYAQAMPGLVFFKKELAAIGKPNMKVILTETGWTIQSDAGTWTRDQVADWTVQAYQNVWLTEPNILGVTPFILRDASWDKFAWTQTDGTPYPVYTKVRAYRCSAPGAQNCQ